MDIERTLPRSIGMIFNAIHNAFDLQSVAKGAVEAMVHYNHSPSVGIFLYEEGAPHLKLLCAGINEKILQMETELPMGKSLSGLAVRRREIISCEDLRSDQRIDPEILKALLKEGFVSAVSVPLLYRNRTVGAMSLIFKERYVLTESEREILLMIGKAIGLALANAQHTVRLESEINERKRAEEEKEKLQKQLFQAQKMESIGRLVSAIAHDFNNMLIPIIGYANVLLKSFPVDSQLLQHARAIKEAADRAATLTKQLLVFSRGQRFKMGILNPNLVILGMENMLRRLIGEDVELILSLEPNLRLVRADKGQIEQIIMNLVVNARDAMPQGGKIVIKTENADIDDEYCRLHAEARPGEFIRLSVEDTGIGMDEKTIHHIFEPFFTTKTQGTGLGLSIVHRIVKQHNGWINVYSEPGWGSVFKIYLPTLSRMNMKPDEDKKEISSENLQGNGEKVLVVEDESAVRRFAVDVLRDNGYRTFDAHNTEKALRLFLRRRGDFHLIFSDVILPDGTGLRLVDKLLDYKPGLKVLLSSGYPDERLQWKAITGKNFIFLQKPYTSIELLKAVKEALVDKSGKIKVESSSIAIE